MDAVDRLYDCDVLDRHGRRIGPVTDIWLDGRGRPLWASVDTGNTEAIVPIRGAQIRERRLVVPVELREVDCAPHIAAGAEGLSDSEQVELYDHYGLTTGSADLRLVRHARPVSATSRPSPPAKRPEG